MMNILLTAANGAFAYYRGKQTGIWGLVGLAVALLFVFNWDTIQPIFEVTGIVSFLNKLGLITPNEPGLTGYKIFFAAVHASIAFIVIGTICLMLFLLTVAFAQTKLGTFLMVAGLICLSIPFFIPYWIYIMITDILGNKKMTKGKSKEEIQEMYRLQKNAGVIDFLKNYKIAEIENELFLEQMMYVRYVENEDGKEEAIVPERRRLVPNALSMEEALSFLNRLPMEADTGYLLGITHEREFYMVLPRPINLDTTQFSKDTFVCYSMSVEGLNRDFKREFNISGPAYLNIKLDVESQRNIAKDDFELFINPFRFNDITKVFGNFQIKTLYKNYVRDVHRAYFEQKEELTKQLDTCSTEAYPTIARQLYDLSVGNEDIILLMNNEFVQ